MLLKNRRTNAALELSYQDFRKNLQKKFKLLMKVVAVQNSIKVITNSRMTTLLNRSFILTSNRICGLAAEGCS